MRSFWCLIILLFCIQRVRAEILYVPSQYNTIQSALDNALDSDNVVVSPGTYLENIDFKGKAVTVRSTDPNDPNIIAATIIDGSNPADPNFGSTVLFKSGEDHNSVLAGFTITGGTGSWLAVSWDLHQIYWNRCGGGVLCCNMSEPTITKNVFVNNRTGEGGGIYIYGDPVNPNAPSNPPVHVKPVITGNIFFNNTTLIAHGFTPPNNTYPATEHGDGGAIVCFQGVDAAITGNSIVGNHAEWYGGGIHCRQWSNGVIAENEIADNNSALGAGIHVTYTSSPTIRDNFISGNTASGLGGGGLYIYATSKPLVERNIITQNSSSNGAGIGVYWESSPTIRDNLIYKNQVGAAIRMVSSTPVIVNNTITRNPQGGIVTYSGSSPTIKNNLITSNGIGYGIYVSTGDSAVITYNNVWANKAGGNYGGAIPDQTGINGNISTDPNFVNPDTNNFHLDLNSPCINTGDPNYAPGPNETDYDGEQRVFNLRGDIGADEVVTNPFDLNTNGVIDFYELGMLTDEWLQTIPSPQTDFHTDGIVNFADFAELAGQWLWTAGWHQ